MAICGGMLLAALAEARATGAEPSPEPSVQALMAGYAQTRQAFRSYLLSFDRTELRGLEAEGGRPVREIFEQLEIRTDGWRWKLLEKHWGGEISGNYVSKGTAASQPSRVTCWDGNWRWCWYTKPNSAALSNRGPTVAIFTNPTPAELMATVTNRTVLNYMVPEIPFCPCHTMHAPWSLDRALPHARRVVLRPKPETVAGAACRVVEAEWQSASHPYLIPPGLPSGGRLFPVRTRGVFWLDPERGCQMIRMELELHEVKAGKESVTRITREKVRLEKLDGFWLPVEMDEIYRGTGTRKPYKTVIHYRCLKFIANPDHRALGSFDRREITNGTRVTFADPKVFSTKRKRFFRKADWLWQDGQVIPRGKGTDQDRGRR